MEIRAYTDADKDALIALSLRAWEPVFAGIRQAMPAEIYGPLVPDWRGAQRQAVEAVCMGGDDGVWVGEIHGAIAGFVVARLMPDDYLGEIHMLAVDPEFQNRGSGLALTEHAVQWISDQIRLGRMVPIYRPRL